MEQTRYYQNGWNLVRTLAGGALKAIFAFECELVAPEVPNYFVVANHNCDLDPALVALSFPKQMFFVASEHVFRFRLGGWLLQRLFAPISRIKGATDASAAMDVIRTLRTGGNVCLFAEGNRSFNGVTGPIFPATGKLAKASGAALVTYKLEGGYLTTPRWAKTQRRGRMRGYCVNVYSAEQLKAMTAKEVNQAIANDLLEDAFTRQLADPQDYRGKRLAEGLEDALFLCPRCGGIRTLKGRDDQFGCQGCGLTLTYTKQGFFSGESIPFTTVRDWDAWQREALDKLVQEGLSGSPAQMEKPLFKNPDLELLAIDQNHKETMISKGTLSMSLTAMGVGEQSFSIGEISDMALNGPTTLVFTVNGCHYEIPPKGRRYCGRAYLLLYQAVKAYREKIDREKTDCEKSNREKTE